MERVHKFFLLPPNERLILAQAWGLFLLAELALRILPYTRLISLSDKVFLKRTCEPLLALAPPVPRLTWLVEVAGRCVPVGVTCLKKAIVLSWLLGRRGIPTKLQIGVSRDEGRLKAHAWLELGGQVILDRHEGEHYEPLLPTGRTDRHRVEWQKA